MGKEIKVPVRINQCGQDCRNISPFALPDFFSRTGRMLVSFSEEGKRDFSHEGG